MNQEDNRFGPSVELISNQVLFLICNLRKGNKLPKGCELNKCEENISH
jgi:hypothetical protein